MRPVLLQACIRPELAVRVAQALLDAGCRDILQSEVRRLVPGLDRESYEFSVQLGQAVELMVRLEAVGTTEEAARWVEVIRGAGFTGRHGDGLVAVVPLALQLHLSGDTPPREADRS